MPYNRMGSFLREHRTTVTLNNNYELRNKTEKNGEAKCLGITANSYGLYARLLPASFSKVVKTDC